MTLKTTSYYVEENELSMAKRGALWSISVTLDDGSGVEFEFDDRTACMIREFIAEDIPTCIHRQEQA